MEFFPAPWNLNGKGYIFLYKFDKDFIKKNANVPAYLENKFAGGLGSVMLVDYASSNAGPYGELLFIPGKFNHQGKKLNTISKIYVSTMKSVVNGKKNWGIKKEQADFKFKAIHKNKERIRISVAGTTAADITLSSFGPSFPITTRFLPFPLVQEQNGKYYYTRFFGNGKGRLAKIDTIKINGDLFPDISGIKPIAVIKAEPFAITFPIARVSRHDR
ncbi:hypothetical protein acsn021_15080 [Anaerocolumna cellulosilytica]|uniref:Uncharacterized protein n=1 Tax=Anaerocolumna cellulosilytica TaxID=433286 RepID=A0A6S6QXZ4_9FIRM|nr:hypothetical protein [Anaerocolumna cellulosilytica]MBB5196677.1 hypothetical protein [Anaerocolumna cellulosilytica]BCJ93939.1 hypothetical protein acsn021_15080 [Anaerocolumna cellulosilytica]